MADKRSPDKGPPLLKSSRDKKRAKTFPLAHDGDRAGEASGVTRKRDEATVALDRRPTEPALGMKPKASVSEDGLADVSKEPRNAGSSHHLQQPECPVGRENEHTAAQSSPSPRQDQPAAESPESEPVEKASEDHDPRLDGLASAEQQRVARALAGQN